MIILVASWIVGFFVAVAIAHWKHKQDPENTYDDFVTIYYCSALCTALALYAFYKLLA